MLSKTEIIIDSISTINGIIVFITKRYMNKKIVNRMITIISVILKFVFIIFSFVKIFVLLKDFVKFENNNFLYSIEGSDLSYYTYKDRISLILFYNSINFFVIFIILIEANKYYIILIILNKN